jgi:hypothetical protein
VVDGPKLLLLREMGDGVVNSKLIKRVSSNLKLFISSVSREEIRLSSRDFSKQCYETIKCHQVE